MGNDKTLVGLSRPRYCALRRRLSAGPTTDRPISRPLALRPNAALAQTVISVRVGAQVRTRLRTSIRTLLRPLLTRNHSGPRRPSLSVARADDAPRPAHRKM